MKEASERQVVAKQSSNKKAWPSTELEASHGATEVTIASNRSSGGWLNLNSPPGYYEYKHTVIGQ